MKVQWPEVSLNPRVLFLTPDENRANELLHQARAHCPHSAVLHWHGSLISNLSVLENLILACCWHKRQRSEVLIAKAQTQLTEWCGDSALTTTLLQQRPAQLNDDQKRVIILLRARLQNPAQLLISHDWFSVRTKARDRSPLLLQRHFADAVWWWFATEQESSTVDSWYTLTPEQWCVNGSPTE